MSDCFHRNKDKAFPKSVFVSTKLYTAERQRQSNVFYFFTRLRGLGIETRHFLLNKISELEGSYAG